MYLTVKETAEFLEVPISFIENLIIKGKIRYLYDSNGVILIYKDQFKTHFEQIEKYKLLLKELENEPIPEDKDIKDED